MKVTLVVCVALLAAVLVLADNEVAPPVLPAGSRVGNGKPAVPRQLPYMAYIESFNDDGSVRHWCAGSLITRSAVLTRARRCVTGASKWTVRLGAINRTGEDANAWCVVSAMAMSHPEYNSENQDNNIAIIQLPRLAPVNEYIEPVHLSRSPANSSYIGCQGIVAGWGDTAPDSGLSDVLRWAEVVVVHNDFCKQLAPEYAVTDRQLCAGSNNTTVYMWDFGTPLVLNITGTYTQIGVFSELTTWNEFNISHPGIYTRVTPYLDWIKLHTESERSQE